MNKISAVIVATNNPPHLFETLASIDSFVSEIILGTINVPESVITKLKENKKIKCIKLSDSIAYADLIKEDLKKMASGSHILYMDPDELFPQHTISFIKNNLENFDYFKFPRKNIIFLKWIEHSFWWPDYQIRFFKKNAVVWPKKIHPIPKTIGKEYVFEAIEKNAIIHYNYESIDEYIEKATRYAKSEAQIAIKNNVTITLTETIKRSLNEFISRFFAHEGFKDGSHGFVLSFLQVFYYFLVFFYYWEAKKYEPIEQKTMIHSIYSFFFKGFSETTHWIIEKKLSFHTIKLKIINKFLGILKI